tara:strand:- start:3752 stop:4369 length:618 start_codon:yes stop_codon:yes gene_type:complete
MGMRENVMEGIGTFFVVLAFGISGEPLSIGLMYAAMIYIGAHISGAHYNPGITFAFFILKKIKLKKALSYMLSQIVGAFLASIVLLYISTVVFFVEAPGNTSLYQQAISEVLFTLVLVLVAITVSSSKALSGNKMYGFIIGLTLTGITFLGLPISGAVFNPALSIGSALFDYMFSGGSYYSIPLYTIAPFSGAALAAFAYKYLNN